MVHNDTPWSRPYGYNANFPIFEPLEFSIAIRPQAVAPAITRDPGDTSAKRLKNYPLVLGDIKYTVLFLIRVSQRLYYTQTVGRGLAEHAVLVDDAELPLPVLDRSVVEKGLDRSGSCDLFRERHH